jgi:hypothetical protein
MVTAGLIVAAGQYGYHRDELYFIVAGQHPDWGYPDQPPMAPLLAAGLEWLAPGSLVALRLPSALAMGGLVVLGALLAREMGGGRYAQLLTAATVGVATFPLAVGHLLSTATFDLLAWVALSWVVARILRTGDDRLWLVAGAIAGLALQNKHLIAFLAAGLGVAFLLAPEHRRHLRSPQLWGGIGLAFAIWLPNLIWQAAHGWPALTIARDIAGEEMSLSGRVEFVVLQLVIFGAGGTILARAGLLRLIRDPTGRPYRPFAVPPDCCSRSSPSAAARSTTWPGCSRCSSPPVRWPSSNAARRDGWCRSWSLWASPLRQSPYRSCRSMSSPPHPMRSSATIS